MNKFITLLSLLSSLLMIGCSTVNELTVEVTTPAQYTFPRYVRNVVVVNNATRQPAQEGHFIGLGENKQKGIAIPLDSLATNVVTTCAELLNQSNYFLQNSPIEKSQRTDNDYTQTKEFPQAQIQKIADQNDADLVIVLEKIPVESNLSIYNFGEGTVYKASYEMVIKAQFTLHYPREDKKDSPLLLNDTVRWERYAETPAAATDMLPSLEEINDELTYRVCDAFARKIVPSTASRTRYYYTSIDPNMKDAARYLKHNMWIEAFWIWEYLSKKEKNPTKKAEIYINMALYYELNDNFAEAIRMVRQAGELLDHLSPEKLDYVQTYLNELQERQQSRSRLEEQLSGMNR